MILTIFFALFAVCNSQQLIDLKSYPGGKDTKIDATGPYALYVTANSDDDSLLKQIKIKSANNPDKSLYDLKTFKLQQNTGLLQPFQITNEAVFSSPLTDEQMNQLKGSLYISTAQQLQNNKGFFVYNVEVSEKIVTTGLPEDCTIVFLNSNFNAPWHSSTISAWKQEEGTSVYMYEGIPKDTAEKKNSHIFSNPVLLSDNTLKFIPSVDFFSLNLPAFYFRINKGVQFVIEPNYNDINNSITTSKTTTGFYMKPITSVDRKVIINTGHDNNFSGTTGVNVVGNVPQNANFVVSGPGNWIATPSDTIQGWSAATISDTLGLETVNSVAGEVFAQYYIIQGEQLGSSTTMLPGRITTARGVESTTKSATAIQVFTSVLIPILGARFL